MNSPLPNADSALASGTGTARAPCVPIGSSERLAAGYPIDVFVTPRLIVMQILCGLAVYWPKGSHGAKPADT